MYTVNSILPPMLFRNVGNFGFGLPSMTHAHIH